MRIDHPFEPVCPSNASILILGTMPSPVSRAEGFYYGHKRNRFWPVLAAVLGEETPRTLEEKLSLLHKNGIALWDVLAACDIENAADASIKNGRLNDIAGFVKMHGIRTVFANGATCAQLARRAGVEVVALPSTSPANAQFSFARLTACWRVVADYVVKNG